jgi:hypothetical protein
MRSIGDEVDGMDCVDNVDRALAHNVLSVH